jgi:hypothetical protein
MHKFPHLASFAKSKVITVRETVNTEYLEDLFYLPLSVEAYAEFQDLEELCIKTTEIIQSGNKDTWSYIWGNECFSVKEAYKVLIGFDPTPPHLKWIWKSSCQAKHKYFFGSSYMTD